MIPPRLRNAVTSDMADWGYGQGYRYPHDEGGFAAGETYFPERLRGSRYYVPTQNGLEERIGARLRRLRGEGMSQAGRPQDTSDEREANAAAKSTDS